MEFLEWLQVGAELLDDGGEPRNLINGLVPYDGAASCIAAEVDWTRLVLLQTAFSGSD